MFRSRGGLGFIFNAFVNAFGKLFGPILDENQIKKKMQQFNEFFLIFSKIAPRLGEVLIFADPRHAQNPSKTVQNARGAEIYDLLVI